MHESFDEVLASAERQAHFFYFTTKAPHAYTEAQFQQGDYLVFGRETKGLPEELLVKHKEECVRIPMIEESRSLNLSNSVAIAVYEGLRQNNFEGLSESGQLHRLHW